MGHRNGHYAIVGANTNNEARTNSGSAYVFNVHNGKHVRRLTAFGDETSGDQFGASVAIRGNLTIVGAPRDEGQIPDSGSVYTFDLNLGPRLKLTAPEGDPGDRFGHTVAISEDTILVGAVGDNGGAGSVYVFDVGNRRPLRKLVAADGEQNDRFGESIAISGNIAIIGASRIYGGLAYVFDVTTGEQLFKLTPSDGLRFTQVDSLVSISGNTAVVKSRFRDEVYVFDVTTGEELLKLTTPDDERFRIFSNAISISGQTVIVGASEDDLDPILDDDSDEGSAYLFDLASSTIPEPHTLGLLMRL